MPRINPVSWAAGKVRALPQKARQFPYKYPVTAKLHPFSGSNLRYLLTAAILTRATTGALRVMQNMPSKLHSHMSEEDKQKSFYERLFVEMFGTGGFVFLLHFPADVVTKIAYKLQDWNKAIGGSGSKYADNWFDAADKLKEVVQNIDASDLPEREKSNLKNAFTKAWEEIFGLEDYEKYLKKHGKNGQKLEAFQRRDTPYRILYEGNNTYEKLKLEFREALKSVSDKHRAMPASHLDREIDRIWKYNINRHGNIDKFFRHNKFLGIAGIFASIITAVAFGGYVIQKTNDTVIAPLVDRWVGDKEKEAAAQQQRTSTPRAYTTYLGQPQQSQSQANPSLMGVAGFQGTARPTPFIVPPGPTISASATSLRQPVADPFALSPFSGGRATQ